MKGNSTVIEDFGTGLIRTADGGVTLAENAGQYGRDYKQPPSFDSLPGSLFICLGNKMQCVRHMFGLDTMPEVP